MRGAGPKPTERAKFKLSIASALVTVFADISDNGVARRTKMMHDELWAAVQLKLDNAEFHLAQMRRSIQGPERTL